ncbi:MAG TPA: hypothetical protein VFP05_19120 [Thermomicrobiales bacterium]|nr:hypothetical protein [Thermomicrobiales bacterium]
MNFPEFLPKWKSNRLAERCVDQELDEKRRVWLDPPGATETDLKKRTLTNRYNAAAQPPRPPPFLLQLLQLRRIRHRIPPALQLAHEPNVCPSSQLGIRHLRQLLQFGQQILQFPPRRLAHRTLRMDETMERAAFDPLLAPLHRAQPFFDLPSS